MFRNSYMWSHPTRDEMSPLFKLLKGYRPCSLCRWEGGNMDERRGDGSRRPSVLIADMGNAHRDQLARDLCRREVDVWLADDVAAAVHVVEVHTPTIVALELELRDGSWRDVMNG